MDYLTRRFSYYFRIERYLLSVIVLIFCILFLFYQVIAGDRGLIIQRLIRLNPEQARVFYIITGTFMGLIFLWTVAVSIFVRKQIYMDNDRIIIPRPFTGKMESILYHNIINVTIQEINKMRIATIHTKYNQQYQIVMNFLDSENEYNEILNVLSERTKAISN